MNVYLINEDGENFCIKAKTMAEAVSICEYNYLHIMAQEENYEEDAEIRYYHEQILQSCSLISELKND